MKAMTRQQLAARAGVSVRTLNTWFRACERELSALGLTPRMRVLPPSIVHFLAEKYCIDVEIGN